MRPSMALISSHRRGFASGFTEVTSLEDPSGIALGVLRTEAPVNETAKQETVWLLLDGELVANGEQLARRSLFDDGPSALHVSAGANVELNPSGPCELMVFRSPNTTPFPSRVYQSVKDEHRGKGRVRDAAFRFVRTVF